MQDYFSQLRREGFKHWLAVAILILIGNYIGEQLSELNMWIELRYKIYQYLQGLNVRQPRSQHTVLVLIDDEEYWKNEPARRIPIKRDYLARLLKELDAADPAVIALDFDLRSPVVDDNSGLIEHRDYQAETNKFLEAVEDVSHRRPVVLPKTVNLDEDHQYLSESAIFGKFKNENVRVGYISLPYDLRQIPLGLITKNEGQLDSFSMAIVSFISKDALERVEEYNYKLYGSYTLPYGSYIKDFKKHVFYVDSRNQEFVFYADRVKKEIASKEELTHKIVIVGGAWHKSAYNRGDQIDTHLTPVGRIQGAFIHANYVEALLDSRVSKLLPEGIVKFIEIFVSISVSIILVLSKRPLLIITFICLILVISTYFLLQNLGIFFDFFIPTLLIVSHFAIEQIIEWREKALKYDKMKAGRGEIL